MGSVWHGKTPVYNMRNLLLTFLFLFLTTMTAQAQNDGSVWRKTIIVTTLDGATMEYLIDENTKVRVEKPHLVIETEGVVLNYELERMGQLRYGRRLITEGIAELSSDQPFSFDNETLYFDRLADNSLIKVFTTDGKQILMRRCSGSTCLSLSTLTPGAYVVKVNGNTYKIVRK